MLIWNNGRRDVCDGTTHCCNTDSHNRSGSLFPAFASSIIFCATNVVRNSNEFGTKRPHRYRGCSSDCKLGVDPALPFNKKLNSLEQMGKIGKSEKELSKILTDAGGAAAHRGWKPRIRQLDTLMTIGEQFLHRTIILEGRSESPQRKNSVTPEAEEVGNEADDLSE